MDLQFFIETIKSGLAFGFMQIAAIGSVKEISSRLKSIFKGQSLIEKEYDRIAGIVKEAYEKDKTEEGFIKYLENSDKLKEILKSKESIGNMYQETKGNNSPNINGDNNTVNYGSDTEKKVRNDIEKAIKDYYDKIHKEFTEDPDKIISSFPISEFYIKQDIEEYIGEEDWKQPINEEQYIKNWCEQSLEKILLLLGEPGHGKSSLCMKMVSDFCERKFCPKEIKKVFSFSLNPTVWIKELENSLDVKNIFILPHKQIMLNGKYNDVILDKEYLEESLIFLDGYDELYLKLQEYSKNTISFLEDLKIIAKDWNLKIIVTSRKTCINPSDLYKYGYKICQLTKLTKKKQKEWINDVYNTKLSPEKPYDIERLYNSFEEDNIQSKILEFLLKASGNKYDIEKMYNMYQNDNIKFKVLELLELPILLQLIVSKYFYDDAQNIAELYDKLFEEILNTRKEMTIGSFDEDKAEEFKQIFGLYAYNIYQNNDTYTIVESTELEKEKNIKWKSLLLFYITSEKKQKEYYIEFVHRSFYQYFQAWYFYNLLLEIVKKNKKRKVANLFEAICERKLEKDVIDMIGQISQNQKEIQKQEQINFILDIFEKTDGFIKTKENGKCCIPIGESNVLDRAEILMYNLLMLLNIILPNGLTLLKNSRVETLMKKFDMNEIYLPKITMSGLTLDKVNFIRANLKQADLKDTTLEGAHLEGAYLEKADLEWTHLERADLRKAHLERADLKGADLRAANLEKANLEEADLKGADLGRAHLENAHLGEANLGETDLQYAHLKRADLEEVYLVGAHLRGVHLENANLIKADFDPIILKYAILENTKISKNKFDGIATLGIDVNKIIWCD